MTLRQAAQRAIDIQSQWAEAADRDAGFDAGEFSGPACSRAADREVAELAAASGFTVDEVNAEVNRLCNEDLGEYLEKSSDE